MAVEVRVLKETAAGERRVAATPETVKKLIAAGARVLVERGAGDGAGFVDAAYADAGAGIVDAQARDSADLLLCVQPPSSDAIAGFKTGATLVMQSPPHRHGTDLELGGSYFFLLANTRNAVHKGDRLTLVIGNARLEHVVAAG